MRSGGRSRSLSAKPRPVLPTVPLASTGAAMPYTEDDAAQSAAMRGIIMLACHAADVQQL